ncbi:MAG: glutamate racemase [Deltaproteobacteria bacterium]|jgi:glutamate racemase|nr:glutamate racemase [Deltaproteobacteria bacterium]MBW2534085.1 glutamate racemase [Deltaproteobacteria bacterium]
MTSPANDGPLVPTGRAQDRSAPLGVFDSGLGGLTVVRALQARCPTEDIVYLGDTARVPYGTRSAATVVRYALSCARLLARSGVKALVVACNTVSAVALDMLRADLDLPISGVIVPGARAAVEAARSPQVGVLGTAGTIGSGAYTRAVSAVSSRIEVVGRAAPLLVALAEEGWTHGEVPRLVVRRYLEPLCGPELGALVLGCTHFPLLRSLIEQESAQLCGRQVPVVDSAEAASRDVAAFLAERGLDARRKRAGSLRLLVTDRPAAFTEVAARFLGARVTAVEQVDLPPG